MGPALPDLALYTNSTIPQASVLIVGNSATYILGSLAAGVLLEYIDGFFVVSVGFLLQAASYGIAFLFTNLLALTGLYSIANFFGTIGMAGEYKYKSDTEVHLLFRNYFMSCFL